VQGDTVEVEVRQFQDGAWPTYRMPVQLRINYADSTDTTVVVVDSLRSQVFRIPISRPLQHVEFDPDCWILKRMFPWPLHVQEDGQLHEFGLSQNYPNPFNPSTTINFSLPLQESEGARGRVGVGSITTLKVYDLLGREVAALVNEKLTPGTYTVAFDGSRLAAGVYYCRLQSGTFSETRKMILIK
jgi:hypothetical protein